MKPLIIGIDLGTSSVKAGLYDLEGREVARACQPLTIYTPAADQAEQDPGEWWSAVQGALHELMGQCSPGSILGIGMCAQCPGQVLADGQGEPIGRAIIWRDQRAGEEAAWLAENVSPEKSRRWVGLDTLGDLTLSPARVLWLKRHRGEDLRRAAWLLQPKDFIGLKFTGVAASDVHTAFTLVHPETYAYPTDLLDLLGVSVEQMPPVGKMTALAGRVTAEAASVTGLNAGTPLFTGTIDAYCDTLAGGGLFPGKAVDVAGTSEIISLGTDSLLEGSGVYLARMDVDGSFLCGPLQAGPSLLAWLERILFGDGQESADYSSLELLARNAPPGADGLYFLPYLHGERAPIWDPQARGAFLGISGNHDGRHFSRAVYEGIGFAVRHVLEACEQVSGLTAESVTVCGGGARSSFWSKVKADILQKKVFTLQTAYSACLGAAMIAAVGAGEFPDLRSAWKGMCRFAGEILPDAGLAEVYDQRYRQYRQAYPALKMVP